MSSLACISVPARFLNLHVPWKRVESCDSQYVKVFFEGLSASGRTDRGSPSLNLELLLFFGDTWHRAN